jgi:hypothetical protein
MLSLYTQCTKEFSIANRDYIVINNSALEYRENRRWLAGEGRTTKNAFFPVYESHYFF